MTLHPNSFLTVQEVTQIRELYSEKKYTQRLLGKKFGVSQSEVSRIVSNKRCKINGSSVGMK
jgi:hypothetical protein